MTPILDRRTAHGLSPSEAEASNGSPAHSTRPGVIDGMPAIAEGALTFGPFRLLRARQLLLRDGEPVRLGSRATALLIALIDSGGELIGKDALMRQVWPDTYVEEANLRVHVSALRRALGDTADPPEYILNVTGRGYRFLAPVASSNAPAGEAATLAPALPPLQIDILGREEAIATLRERLRARRFVTITGPGGIGKSTVAHAVATTTAETFAAGVARVDFSTATDALAALANALKMSVQQDDPLPSLVEFLRPRRLLLVLDSCEHLIGELAQLTEVLLREAPELHVLATSIEPMRAEGEWIYRLPALDIPAEAENLDATAVLQSAAVALFVERAHARSESFAFGDEQVPHVVEICRRLDGNPFAIELAAARVDVFGVADLARHLDQRFEFLTGGRRTAASRHQTLRDLLDWSHDHLSDGEQAMLRRLSVFRAAFSLEGAQSVAGLGASNAVASVNDLAGLVRKSLIVAETGEGRTRYRLLDSTRAYAAEKAALAGEDAKLKSLHARYLEGLVEGAEQDWSILPTKQWHAAYGGLIEDVRAALDWAFSSGGDARLGLRLTALVLPMAVQRGLIDELRGWMDRAIAVAESLVPREYAAEIRIHTNYATLAQNQKAVFGSQARAFQQALKLADLSRDRRLRLEPLIGYSAFELGLGGYRDALRHANEASEIAEDWGDDLAQLGAHRVLAQAALFNGEVERSYALANWVVLHRARKIPWGYGAIAVDRGVSMRIVMARALWLLGRPGEAMAIAMEALARAREDSPLAVCQALSLAACPVALWSGDDDIARKLADELIEEARRFTLEHWHSWGLLFDTVLRRRRDPGSASAVLPRGSLQTDTLVTFDESAVTAEIAERAGHQDGWCEPEIARAAALQLKPRQAAQALQQAMERAAGMKALGWQLRIGISLADLHVADAPDTARSILEPIVGRFTEGVETGDLRRATALLESL